MENDQKSLKIIRIAQIWLSIVIFDQIWRLMSKFDIWRQILTSYMRPNNIAENRNFDNQR